MESNELLEIKKKIEEKQQLLSRYEGREESVQKRFEELGCSSFEEAQLKLSDLTSQIEETKVEYQDKLATFQEKYPQLFSEQ